MSQRIGSPWILRHDLQVFASYQWLSWISAGLGVTCVYRRVTCRFSADGGPTGAGGGS